MSAPPPKPLPTKIRDIRELAREHAEEAVKALVRCMRSGDPASSRSAAMNILAYAYGPPEQKYTHSISVNDEMKSAREAAHAKLATLATRKPNTE